MDIKLAAILFSLVVLASFGQLPLEAETPEPVQPTTVEQRVVDLLCKKEIAALGEPVHHGGAEAFRIKAWAARELIETCGFDVLLFEAPIYDFLGFQKALAEGDASQRQLDQAIGRFWQTRELAGWRRALYEKARSGELTVGGLDDQISATSEYARQVLPDLIFRFSSDDEGSDCRAAVQRHLFWRYDEKSPYDETEKSRLSLCASRAAKMAKSKDAGEADQILLENLANLQARQVAEEGALERDAQMDRNLRWYEKNMDPGRRVLIWTSTVHATRQRGEIKFKPLGAFLAERLGESYGALGIAAKGGEFSRAGMPAEPITPAAAEALESLVESEASFFDRAALQRIGVKPSRLFGRSMESDWSLHFDAIVIVREEKAPSFD